MNTRNHTNATTSNGNGRKGIIRTISNSSNRVHKYYTTTMFRSKYIIWGFMIVIVLSFCTYVWYLVTTINSEQSQYEQAVTSSLKSKLNSPLPNFDAIIQEQVDEIKHSLTDEQRHEQTRIVPTIDLLQQAHSSFYGLYHRAKQMQQKCTKLIPSTEFPGFDTRIEMPFTTDNNDTVASLPSFGILNDIDNYYTTLRHDQPITAHHDWPSCEIPPPTECSEKQLTVIFMAYNPDRLGITLKEIKNMVHPNIFKNLVAEIIIVWNGPREVSESDSGKELLKFMDLQNQKQQQDETNNNTVTNIRIVYPLKDPVLNLKNDLMNRYHPMLVQVTKTKGILYYDDDGPFYSYDAVVSGFELWKRHPQQQMGAMSRQLTYSKRQAIEEYNILSKNGTVPTDKEFISHCVYNTENVTTSSSSTTTITNDQVEYDFHYFANYDANMVLPSGSMIHVNYLCYLWHPIFAKIRQFVLDHPVHPDDMTVSMIVSQLSGYAPRVYSRRISYPKKEKNKKKKVTANQRRRLLEMNSTNTEITTPMKYTWRKVEIDYESISDDDEYDNHIIPIWEQQQLHRKLLFNINWDAGSGMNEKKQYWANLRTEAINSLVRYFGSLNSGSIGWCANTSYYDATGKQYKTNGKCNPIMAPIGSLPWMNPDGTPKDTCP